MFFSNACMVFSRGVGALGRSPGPPQLRVLQPVHGPATVPHPAVHLVGKEALTLIRGVGGRRFFQPAAFPEGILGNLELTPPTSCPPPPADLLPASGSGGSARHLRCPHTAEPALPVLDPHRGKYMCPIDPPQVQCVTF